MLEPPPMEGDGGDWGWGRGTETRWPGAEQQAGGELRGGNQGRGLSEGGQRRPRGRALGHWCLLGTAVEGRKGGAKCGHAFLEGQLGEEEGVASET